MKRVNNQLPENSKPSKSGFAKVWNFLWHEDSIWSWLANIVIAFILIKFIVYPVLSLLLGTGLPIVAVVSGSMEHKIAPICDKYLTSGLCYSYSETRFDLCGKSFTDGKKVNMTSYWQNCGGWYEQRNISQNMFLEYSFSSGFNTGDVMVVRGKNWQSLKVGDIAVWRAMDGTPIIHRIVAIDEINGVRTISTKGDHNNDQISGGPRTETRIGQAQYVGIAVLRIPYLGYVKLFAARAMGFLFS